MAKKTVQHKVNTKQDIKPSPTSWDTTGMREFAIVDRRTAQRAIDTAVDMPKAKKMKILRAAAKFLPRSAARALKTDKTRNNLTGTGGK